MKVVLSTRNLGKTEQVQALFAGSSITLLTLDQAGIAGQGLEKKGATIQDNALSKAVFAHDHRPDLWAMADDTGIFIKALDGRPGADTANWYGGEQDTRKRTEWVLRQLADTKDRSATFRTVVAVVSPRGSVYRFEGDVRGQLLLAPRAKWQHHMPYASIFLPDGSDKVLAEMTTVEENAISHRGKAFLQARTHLESVY